MAAVVLLRFFAAFPRSLKRTAKRRIRPFGSSLPAPSIPNRVPSKSQYERKLGTVMGSEMNHPEGSWSGVFMKLQVEFLVGRSKGLVEIVALSTRGRGHSAEAELPDDHFHTF